MESIKYFLFDFWEKESDPRIISYPLMNGGPWIAWSIIGIYAYFVTRLGPRLMKNREPFNLQKPILFYNIFMICLNSWFFFEIIINYRFGIDMNIYNFVKQKKIDYSPFSQRIVWLSYLYLLSKYLDLIETIFFVLRKKFNQISNLHVYHHSVVPMLVHLFIKISPGGGPGAMFPLLNTFIHMVMYTYYTMAALGLYKYLWWKRYLTLIQLTQFIIFGIFGWIFCLYQEGYPKFFNYLGIIQPVIFFYMFYSFYKRSYLTRSKSIDSNSNNLNNNNGDIVSNGHQKINGHKSNGINGHRSTLDSSSTTITSRFEKVNGHKID